MGNTLKLLMAAAPHHSPSSDEKAQEGVKPAVPPPPAMLSSPSNFRFSFRQHGRSQRSHLINSSHFSLVQLIAHRDWQQVLIRATLRPTEISQWQVWTWKEQNFDILPLHLACALQPPQQVIGMLLRFHSDTARTWMSTSTATSDSSRSRRRIHSWVRRRSTPRRDGEATDYSILSSSSQRHNSTASPNEDEDCFSVENSVGDLFGENGKVEKPQGAVPVIDAIQEEDEEVSSRSDDERDFQDAMSSMYEDAQDASTSSKTQIVLQLTANGGLESLALKESKSTEETSSTEGGTVTHELTPHQPRLVSDKVRLLPLHVACLFQASPQVLRLLLDAFPEGVRTPSLGGMLPIHLLCSGGGNSPAFRDDEQIRELFVDQASPLEDTDFPQALGVLVQAYPDSRSVPCRRHGLTPLEYVKQHGWWQSEVWQSLLDPDNANIADDLRHHQHCLQLLSSKPPTVERNFVDFLESSSYDSPFVDDSSDTSGSGGGVPFDIQYDRLTHNKRSQDQRQQSNQRTQPEERDLSDARLSRHVSLFGMLLSQDWEDALALVEEDASQATVWHCGIDEKNVPWKRLPLHLVCAWNAPIGLVQVVLQAYQEGAKSVDPYDGSLPLHVACQTVEPDLDVVKLLLEAFSEGTNATDLNGRCPLHYAAVAAARATDVAGSTSPFAALQALIQEDSESVLCRDRSGKTPSELVTFMIEPSPESTSVIKFLEAIQKAVLETSDIYVEGSGAIEPGSHREV